MNVIFPLGTNLVVKIDIFLQNNHLLMVIIKYSSYILGKTRYQTRKKKKSYTQNRKHRSENLSDMYGIAWQKEFDIV